MKYPASFSLIAIALLFAVAHPPRGATQEQQQHHRYKLIELGTFGGPNSYFTFITRPLDRHGVAAGFADTPTGLNPPFCLIDCFVTRVFLWKNGTRTDLGALPGIGASFPNDINSRGVVAGMSLNGAANPDPSFPVPFFDAVIFKEGRVIDLGTFGGPLSYSGAINDRDQVVGFALTTTPASFDLGDFCQTFPMPTEMRAFIWQRGVLRNMGTLGGTDSCALFINDRGQATGNSFTNSTVNPGSGLGVPTIHPFLWEGDEMRDLGALGNGTVATASGINNRGQVAGASNLADDLTFHVFLWDGSKLLDFGSLGGDFVETIGFNEQGEIVGKAQLPGVPTLHAFLAKNGKVSDLGSQDGDPCSAAISVNVHTQIVGFSDDCSGNNQHAFLWVDGHMTDLNAFVPASSTLTLTVATFINDRGDITAEGVLPNGDQRAILLLPCDDEETDRDGCTTAADTPNAVRTNAVPRVAPVQMNAARTSLSSNVEEDRVRGLWANRRFRSWAAEIVY